MSCKIALVDSGLDAELYEDKITRYVEFTDDPNGEDKFDSNGHGTLCGSAMLSINPDIQFVVIKVLKENNLCSDERLLKALALLRDIDVNIINLSLSTHSQEFTEQYKKVITDLNEQGKVIIASTVNGNKPTLLSELNGTIGIYGNLFERPKHYWYNKSNKIQCVANSVPYLLKGKHGKYELFGGNSKATAIFSGIVSLYWNQLKDCSLAEKETFLEGLALRQSWSEDEVCLDLLSNNSRKMSSAKDSLYSKVSSVLSKKLKVELSDIIDPNGKCLHELGLTRHNAIYVIQAIENEVGIKLNYSDVNMFWFYSLDSLCNNIREVKFGSSRYE
ncbi:MAG: S8 family serine peptidase [Ruminococcus sp.]|uniref:S8 family serine peptidase n=1 Tax=Ruminococcus sp. TaxID=41978 RepID=UPI0025E424CF|nr:S8 family serine peptidase [Ruminococcus sp.]MCR5541244.1 S8 family serine peptidase [Ruminococcus sp.]